MYCNIVPSKKGGAISQVWEQKDVSMWSRKTINVTPEKRERILEAACEEFAKNPYSSMRISRFIKKAGISRASFYIYFRDKEDLFCYMLCELIWEERKNFLDCLRAEQGNFYEAVLKSLTAIQESGKLETYIGLYRKLAVENECRELAFAVCREFYESGGARRFADDCYRARDVSRYGELDKEEMLYAIELGEDIVFRAFTLYALGYSDTGRLEKSMTSQLKIVENALLKKTA